MRTQTIHTSATVTIDDEEVAVEVEASYSRGFAGTMCARNGDPGDPPEGSEVELISVTGPDGPIELKKLSAHDRRALEDKARQKGDDA